MWQRDKRTLMRRFFVEQLRIAERRVKIRGGEARHILKVLRMREGDPVVLVGADGLRVRGRIEATGKGVVSVLIEEELSSIAPPPVRIVLGQALLKSTAMDLVIQKTSELGLSLLIPFTSERTVVKWEEEKATRKLKHWEGIARASVKQSDRSKPLEIQRPLPFSELITRGWSEDAVKIILWEAERAQDLRGLLKGKEMCDEVVGLVGPEGGFSEREITEAKDRGFEPVSLGPRILRAETASIVLVALLQYELGDMSKRTQKGRSQ